MLVDLEGRGLRLVEHGQGLGEDLDRTGRQVLVGVLLTTRAHLAGHLHDPLAAQLVGQGLAFSAAEVGIKDHLGQAVAVAQIDEDHAAVVAVVLHPAAQGDGGSDVRGPELAAGMGAHHRRAEG